MLWTSVLKKDLRASNQAWARSHGLTPYASRGNPPTLLFEASMDGSGHGNFHTPSWVAICENPEWHLRTQKVHPKRKTLPDPYSLTALEMDSTNSSDALLMNVFCCPGAGQRVFENLLQRANYEPPRFGFKARVPLVGGLKDASEVDMKIARHLFEAKLTEKDFKEATVATVMRYAAFTRTFDASLLPMGDGTYRGYQLIRNVLAADHYGATLTVLIDRRRPDLLQEWWHVHSAILSSELRRRCGVLTWQEIAVKCQRPLQEFLKGKYGL